MTENQFSNQFLIAMPSMADPHFSQTVTLICEHNAEGAFGIVVNRPVEVELSDMFEHLNIPCDNDAIQHAQVFLGGPVEIQQGFIIHDTSWSTGDTMIISEQLAMTANKEVLFAIANKEGPAHYLVALGYAGWAAGQLEQEMADNAWLNHPASPDIVFDIPVNDRWQTAAERMGIDLTLLSGESGHA